MIQEFLLVLQLTFAGVGSLYVTIPYQSEEECLVAARRARVIPSEQEVAKLVTTGVACVKGERKHRA